MPSYTIEIDTGKNNDVYFAPLHKMLRGRFARLNCVPLSFPAEDATIKKMPDFPGMVVEIDTDAKRARVIDPLNSEKAKELRGKINTAIHVEAPNAHIRAEPTVAYKIPKTEDLNGWLLYCRRLVKDGFAKCVNGTELWHVKGKCTVNWDDPNKDPESRTIRVMPVDTELEETEAAAAAEEIELEALLTG